MADTDLDLIAHYTDGPSTLLRRLLTIQSRLDDMLLQGYRRDGSESAEFFPPGFQVQQLFEDFTGPNQLIVTTPLADVATLEVPPFGWIGRNDVGDEGVKSGSLSSHGMIFRTGDTSGGVDEAVYTGTLPEGGQMIRARGGTGFFSQDVVFPAAPGDYLAEFGGGQNDIALNGSTTVLDYDGPFTFSTNSNAGAGADHTFNFPTPGSVRPGVRWWFGFPSGQIGGSGSEVFFNPGTGQRLNGATATVSVTLARYLVLLMCVGVHNGFEQFVLVQFSAT